jgi:hypothetical protein
LYDNKLFEFSGDYNELYLSINYKDYAIASIAFTDDFYIMVNVACFYEITGRYPITDFVEF